MGRTLTDQHGREVHYSSWQAEAWFRTGLAKALPMATERPHQRQEEAA